MALYHKLESSIGFCSSYIVKNTERRTITTKISPIKKKCCICGKMATIEYYTYIYFSRNQYKRITLKYSCFNHDIKILELIKKMKDPGVVAF